MVNSSIPDSGQTEKNSVESQRGPAYHHRGADIEPGHAIVARFGFLGPFISKLFELGVEARGVERIPEDIRDETHIWNK